MKKVGILTFQNANNYGAVFQAYALQEAVKSLGADVKVINYDSPPMGLKNVQESRFDDFTRNYLCLTEGSDDIKDIDISVFDIFITGSDQVWNPELTRNDNTYFLNFADDNIIKAAYAASIALDKDGLNRNRACFEQFVPKFDAISLREETHIDFIKEIVGDKKEVTSLIDPSIILTGEEYVQKLDLKDVEDENYIFLFSYSLDPKLVDFANLVSLHTGYKIVAVSAYKDYFLTKGSIALKDATPIQWMEYIKKARLVLTDSFHGLMYSIVFERPFYAYTPARPNVVRIMDALKMLGFEDRRISRVNNIGDVSLELDYTYARKVLEAERKKSYDYLEKVLNMKKG